jgi:hypothetical protein
MMGVLPSSVNGFVCSYLACSDGSGGWPKMGSKIELELCLDRFGDMAYLRDLRS